MKKYIVTGLLVWLPLAVTLWVLTSVANVLNGVLHSVINSLSPVLPQPVLKNITDFIESIPGLGVILVVLVLLLTGMFVANMFGQWVLQKWDHLLSNIPIVKSIYTSVKQVSDTLFSSSGNAFREAVLVQYPRAGSWTIAFVTGKPSGEVAKHLEHTLETQGLLPSSFVSLYVPTTPNPTSGFFLMAPKSDVIPLKMTVDEALKYIISMGVVAPVIVDQNSKPLTPIKPSSNS